MSGNRSRSRGKRGELSARDLLTSRDYEVDALTDGASCADFTAIDREGVAWSVEVKNTKSINVPAFLAQARSNAGRKQWMLMAHIEGTGSFLVLRQGHRPTCWHMEEER